VKTMFAMRGASTGFDATCNLPTPPPITTTNSPTRTLIPRARQRCRLLTASCDSLQPLCCAKFRRYRTRIQGDSFDPSTPSFG
jgi:hypothetical protein